MVFLLVINAINMAHTVRGNTFFRLGGKWECGLWNVENAE